MSPIKNIDMYHLSLSSVSFLLKHLFLADYDTLTCLEYYVQPQQLNPEAA